MTDERSMDRSITVNVNLGDENFQHGNIISIRIYVIKRVTKLLRI